MAIRVLVTGATGFVGKRLVGTLLSRGLAVVALCRRVPDASPAEWIGEVRCVQGSLDDKEALSEAIEGADAVIHLAAQLGHWGTPRESFYRTNVEGTRALVTLSLAEGVGHFIHLSTVGVYGKLQTVPATESHPRNPVTVYGVTKYLSEEIVRSAATDGLRATILRPSHVYGPGDLNTLPLMRLLKRMRLFCLVNGGDYMFQPLFVDDLADAIAACVLRAEVIGKEYVLAGPSVVTVRDYIRLVASVLGIRVTTVTVPYALLRCLAICNEVVASLGGFQPLLSRSRLDFFAGHQWFDTSNARRDFGFSPATDIKDGLIRTIRWYVDNGLLS